MKPKKSSFANIGYRRYHIYIFGVNGYIGRHLAELARSWNLKILGLDLHDSCPMAIDYLPLNISRRELFDRLNFDVGTVFFLSGVTGTEDGFSSYETYTAVNQIGLNHLLDRMVQCQSRARVVFPSTRLVYKGQHATPLAENAEKAPMTLYALNKLASEHLLDMYANRYGISFTVFRICVLFGNRFAIPYSYGIVGFFLSMARQKKNLAIFGDGSIQRTFTHVCDICRIFLETSRLSAAENQILNIGGETLSLLAAAQSFAKKFGVGIDFIPFPEIHARLESGDTILDDVKLQSIFPFKYQHDFQNWLTRQME